MDDYCRGGHSKHTLKVHLIFVTKYRKKLFQSGRRADDVEQYLYDAAKRWGIRYFKWKQTKTMCTSYWSTPKGIRIRDCKTAKAG